jgi:hypothetical protein
MKLNSVRIKQAMLFLSLLTFSLSNIAGPFSVGSKSLGIILGSGEAFDDDYLIVGAGFGYYVVDGLQINIQAQTWLGGDRDIDKITPGVQYVFSRDQKLKPYLGAFVTRSYIEDFEDQDSAGLRAGAIFSTHSDYYVGFGIVYEDYLDCDESRFVDCDDTYAELSIAFLL